MNWIHRTHRVFFYLLILFFPTQLGLHFWPSWTLVLGRRVDYLSPTLFFTDILVFLTLGFWMISSTLAYLEKNPKSKIQIPNKTQISKFKNQNTLLIICLILFVGLNIFFAASRSVAVYHWIKLIEFIALGYYIVKMKPQPSAMSYLLSVSVLYSSLIAIAQFILQRSIGGPFWLLGERMFTSATGGIAQIVLCLPWTTGCPLLLRAYGTFPHPNVLGGFLAAILPLVIIQLSNNPIVKLSNKKMFVKIFLWLTILFGIIALALTFSRSALLVGAIAIATTIIRNKKRTIKRKGWFFVLGIILLATTYVLLTTNASDESVIVRQQLNTAAFQISQSAPLFGVGLGNFLVALPRVLPSRTIYFLQPVHNIYLLLLSEVGVVGLVLFGWFIWWAIRDKRKEISKSQHSIHSAYCLLLIAYLTLGLIDHYPLTLQQGRLLLVFFLSMAVATRPSFPRFHSGL